VISKTSVMGKGFVTLKINEVDPFRRYQSFGARQELPRYARQK